jgi:isoleucyl-tRNA synthetase
VSYFIFIINIENLTTMLYDNIYLLCFILYRDHLIDKNIEQSVSNMQNIIEMGRVMRDRKTIPVKVSNLLIL